MFSLEVNILEETTQDKVELFPLQVLRVPHILNLVIRRHGTNFAFHKHNGI